MALLMLTLIGACADQAPSPTTTPRPSPGPDIEATVEARVRARMEPPLIVTSTPVTLSKEAAAVLQEFALAHRRITDDWDQFHVEFDRAREALINCEAVSVEVALRGFAGLAAEITAGARGLPRPPAIRNLADLLIEAAEFEETAFRKLRDSWQPDSNNVFDDLAGARSVAATAHNEVEDGLFDLLQRTSPGYRNSVLGYGIALDKINASWDRFHQEYNQFRAQEGTLTSPQLVSELSRLVDSFSALNAQVRQLPHATSTRAISQTVQNAADAEELALRNLRNGFQKLEVVVPSQSAGSGSDGLQSSSAEAAIADGDEGIQPSTSEEEEDAATTGVSVPEEEVVATFQARDPDNFLAFGARLVRSNAERRRAADLLAGVLERATALDNDAVEASRPKYHALITKWQAFHGSYDDWRRTGGGCDQSAALTKLGQLATSFSDLARRVRALPASSPVISLGEILVEAAGREEVALSSLRNTWRPYDADIYANVETERNVGAKLRRQVDAGLSTLLSEYGITLADP